MPYIGKTPTVGNFQVCDAISVVNGQAAYTLQVGGTNVAPESANHMLVSLNGILQKPGSSFTISGSTMTFASNLATGDVIDFVQILGNVLDLGQPSDDTVTAAKLNNDIISGQTELAATPADTDELLISDAGTIKRIDFSHLKTGITEADMYRLTSGFNADQDPISSNLERVDDATFGKLGTGVTPSSGIFSFATTGLYLVKFILKGNTYDDNFYSNIYGTSDNSSYDRLAYGFLGDNHTDTAYNVITIETFFNCTNVSTHKIKFTTSSMAGGGGTQVFADTDANTTCFQFIRLGDSV